MTASRTMNITAAALALSSLLATLPPKGATYTLDVNVDGPRAADAIRPTLEKAFEPCIAESTADVTFRAVVDHLGEGDTQVAVAFFDLSESQRLLPNHFNDMAPEEQEALLAENTTCLSSFDLKDLQLPVIKAQSPTVIEAKLVFHR